MTADLEALKEQTARILEVLEEREGHREIDWTNSSGMLDSRPAGSVPALDLFGRSRTFTAGSGLCHSSIS